MAWEKGNQYGKNSGGGRPSYEIEQAHVDKMKALLENGIYLSALVQSGLASPEDIKAHMLTEKMVNKIMDKFHANKIQLQGDPDSPLEMNIKIVNYKDKDDGDNHPVQIQAT